MANVAEILKQAPAGTKLWSNIFGKVELIEICSSNIFRDVELKKTKARYIRIKASDGGSYWFFPDGKYIDLQDGECIIWPSKDHRAWDGEAYKILVNIGRRIFSHI